MTCGLPKAAGRGFRLRNVRGAVIKNVTVEPETETAFWAEEAVRFRQEKRQHSIHGTGGEA
ncbi:MAG TPA: hypothetical protein DIC34_11695 [Treponema sp.]|nr:MAG: hypothetical protein A2001_10940 [Treponema sp. GWC1_61_84]OHE73509.1 MAG: hypothetical protein A2413_16630 [Treponema sp. RIFOXYC1_FULL_61_9]HCM27188.1 hypothetical protein [Treponema sp.]